MTVRSAVRSTTQKGRPGISTARSTAIAVFVGDWAVAQLWRFWVAPIVGGVIGAAVDRFIGKEDSA